MSASSVPPSSVESARDSDSHTLKRSLTWTRVAALGVAISVSGSFAGWNYGLGPGGAGGMIVAAIATGLLFYCLTQAVAELSAAMPSSAGFDAYVGAVLGPIAGFIAGICVALGLAVGTGLALLPPGDMSDIAVRLASLLEITSAAVSDATIFA
jgi:ethanolamine permease